MQALHSLFDAGMAIVRETNDQGPDTPPSRPQSLSQISSFNEERLYLAKKRSVNISIIFAACYARSDFLVEHPEKRDLREDHIVGY
jgi:hypothetical protein